MDSKRFFTLQNHSKVSDVTHLKTMRDILCFYSLTDAARKFNSKGFTGRIHLYSKFKLNLTVHNAINEQRIGRKPTFLLSSLGRGCHSYGVAGGAVNYKKRTSLYAIVRIFLESLHILYGKVLFLW